MVAHTPKDAYRLTQAIFALSSGFSVAETLGQKSPIYGAKHLPIFFTHAHDPIY